MSGHSSLAVDEFVKWVREFLGHSKNWTTQQGFDYKHIYKDQLQYQALNAYINKHNSDVLSQQLEQESWVPWTTYLIALELLVAILLIFGLCRRTSLKSKLVEENVLLKSKLIRSSRSELALNSSDKAVLRDVHVENEDYMDKRKKKFPSTTSV